MITIVCPNNGTHFPRVNFLQVPPHFISPSPAVFDSQRTSLSTVPDHIQPTFHIAALTYHCPFVDVTAVAESTSGSVPVAGASTIVHKFSHTGVKTRRGKPRHLRERKRGWTRARSAESISKGDCFRTDAFNTIRRMDIERDKIIHDELSNEENHFQKHPSSVDSFTVDSMGTSLATFTSNVGSMFSPLFAAMDFYSIEESVNLYVPQLDCEDSDDQSRSLGGYKLCSESNFYVPESIFSGLSNGSSSEFDNITDTEFLLDYRYEDSNLFCDMAEECIGLPSLEDALDAECNHGDRPSEESFIDADYSSLHMAIHQVRYHNQSDDLYSYPDLDYGFFDPQLYKRSLLDIQYKASTLLPDLVPKGKRTNKHIMLVLDLDETLVHSTLDHCDDADFTFPVFFNMKEHTVYVKKRPHLQTFLNRVAEMFEIVVFTASQSFYAEQLLDILDPDQTVISKRAYRESCIFCEGSYVKDLTVLGVDLAKVAIIDNSPQVFKLQVNNGIPIQSWFEDPSDCALISLLPFLESLVDADDVRPIIAKKFGNKE